MASDDILEPSCIVGEHRLQSEAHLTCLRKANNERTHLMHIRLVSSLTAEDETRIATAVCRVVSCLLEQFGIAYTLRIETTDGQIFHETACAEVRPPTANLTAN